MFIREHGVGEDRSDAVGYFELVVGFVGAHGVGLLGEGCALSKSLCSGSWKGDGYPSLVFSLVGSLVGIKFQTHEFSCSGKIGVRVRKMLSIVRRRGGILLSWQLRPREMQWKWGKKTWEVAKGDKSLFMSDALLAQRRYSLSLRREGGA